MPAAGYGQTSCSASTSWGWCAVDFNTFATEDEQRSVNFLEETLDRKISWPRFGDGDRSASMTPQDARNLQPNELVDILLIYALISTLSIEERGDFEDISSIYKESYEVMQRDAELIAGTFSNSSSDGGVLEEGGRYSIDTSSSLIRVTYGCVEIEGTTNEYFAMFKAFWTENPRAPQCGF